MVRGGPDDTLSSQKCEMVSEKEALFERDTAKDVCVFTLDYHQFEFHTLEFQQH